MKARATEGRSFLGEARQYYRRPGGKINLNSLQKHLKVINTSKKTVIAQEFGFADTFWTRMVGLLNRKSLSPQEALIITRCQSVHMFFMRFAIDVIFVSKENKVVGLVQDLRPFQLSPIYFKSSYAIELDTGSISSTKTEIGDQIEIEKYF